MNPLMTSLLVLLLVACGGEDTSAPQPAAPEPVAAAPESPAPCRPAGESAATLSIGPLEFGPDDFAVQLATDPYAGMPVLNFNFSKDAAEALGRVTSELVGQPMPVVIDGETVMSPILREPILGGEMQLTGNFEQDELDTLARRLSPPCDTSD